MRWAERERVVLIPYGGGTSVAGHITPAASDRRVLTLALDRMNRLEDLDSASHIARFQPGVRGTDLEGQLSEHGYRLGHFPQSFEYSTLGGWIATRSSGQQSYGYGRIEDLVSGCRVATFSGMLELPDLPASAAGPDLKQWVLGSEGRLGVITSASVRVSPEPAHESFHAAVFPDWQTAFRAVRQIVDQAVGLSMLRLSDADETALLFQLPALAEQGLSWFGYPTGRCMLLFAVTGTPAVALGSIAQSYALCRAHSGLPMGTPIGRAWQKQRFRGPYLRNSLWDAGYAVDTLETALPWAAVEKLSRDLKHVLNTGLAARNERVVSFAHLSHVYRDGASIYVTYLFRRSADPDELLERWRTLKHAASSSIVRHGGTISHQHGVGTDHLPYLAAEKSELGLSLLQSTLRSLDPHGLLNPGKLVP
jgi:alkyldihydroxyacetonephosphate synthase